MTNEQQGRLFELPAARPPPRAVAGLSSARIGHIAELRLRVELLERGHDVSVPQVDDDGVDLIVDYRLTVQVKSSAGARDARSSFFPFGSTGRFRSHVDVIAVYRHDWRAWWLMPARDFAGRSGVNLAPEYRDAWGVFNPERNWQ